MKLTTTSASLLAVLAFAFASTGCAETASVAQVGTVAPSTQGPRWERRVLANGVELLISDEAGVDARKVAEDIQSEMRSRYIGAR